MKEEINKYICTLVDRYPQLNNLVSSIEGAYFILEKCYEKDKKLLIAGNGGSASDSEHIAGELMKKFKISRPLPNSFYEQLKSIDSIRAENLNKNLDRGLMAIPLVTQGALMTAYINDADGLGVYAQQVYGYGRSGDVFLGISTSGNSENIVNAAIVAKAIGMKTIALTGKNNSKLSEISDITIKVPETETFMIQELHIPIYHCLCMMLEERFFGGNG